MFDTRVDERCEAVGDLFDGADARDAIDHGVEVVAVGTAEELAGGGAGALGVVVEAHEYVDEPSEIVEVALAALCLCSNGHDRPRVALWGVEIGHPSVTEPRRATHRNRLAAGDDERRPADLRGRRVYPHV